MKHIVVMGAPNSRMPNSFYAGICGENDDNFECHNLSMGGCGALHKVYVLNNERFKNTIDNADLLIIETNIMDDSHYKSQKVDLEIIKNHLKWLYEELYKLNKKVLICILFSPHSMSKNNSLICDFHEKLSRHYGFNFINFHRKMLELNLQDYCSQKLGGSHILRPIMYEFGKNIRLSFESFLNPKKDIEIEHNPKFVIVSPQELNTNLNEEKIRDVYYNEKVFWLKDNDKITFEKQYKGLQVLGIHCFIPISKTNTLNNYTSLIFQNKTTKIVKAFHSYNYFNFLYQDFFIDDETLIRNNTANEAITERTEAMRFVEGKASTLTIEGGVRMINFLLAKIDNEKSLDENNLKLENSDVYDFTHLVPPIDYYRDIIESFCIHNKFTITKSSSLQQQIKFGTATQRIHNHLSYKLGQIMIRNSKSLFDYIKLPYLLMAMNLIHKEQEKIYKEKIKTNPNLALPPLESYLDYQEALKEKECFTYKLGEAFIKAYKSWYKGGLIKFYFEAKALEREFKRSLNN
ncbi:MAG: hypothetical protein J1E31_05075 [Helicobacter sp.]|nr:hypothetical protein [Helicobacter sp.]